MSNLEKGHDLRLIRKTACKEKKQIRIINTKDLIYTLIPDYGIYYDRKSRPISTVYCKLGRDGVPLGQKLKAWISVVKARMAGKQITSTSDLW